MKEDEQTNSATVSSARKDQGPHKFKQTIDACQYKKGIYTRNLAVAVFLNKLCYSRHQKVLQQLKSERIKSSIERLRGYLAEVSRSIDWTNIAVDFQHNKNITEAKFILQDIFPPDNNQNKEKSC